MKIFTKVILCFLILGCSTVKNQKKYSPIHSIDKNANHSLALNVPQSTLIKKELKDDNSFYIISIIVVSCLAVCLLAYIPNLKHKIRKTDYN